MSKFKFYFLSLTWGLLTTLVGGVVALALRIAGFKPEKRGYCYYFKVGERWGGFSVGLVVVTDKTPSTRTIQHEHGHALQNCYWGPLMPFVISIPSMLRYWYREFKYNRKGKTPLTAYDDFWVEADATKRGADFFESLGEK